MSENSQAEGAAQIFSGIRVIDLTQGMAGSLITMILADYGADVVRLEPPGGDPMWDHPAYLLWQRGKKSVELDWDSDLGREQVQQLVTGADLFLESLRPGEAAALGLAWDRLHRVLGNGSGEILDAAGFHFGYEKGEIIAANPSYMQLVVAAEKAGGAAVRIPLNARLEHDLPAMAAAVGPRTSLVYIVNPNNPTGTVCDATELREFVRTVSARVPVFIDEAYLECTDDFAGRTCAGLVTSGHNVVVARTFSKIFGMAGCRLGYAVLPEKLAASLRARMTGSLSLTTIMAGIASLGDTAYVTATRAKLKAGREALMAQARSLGRECTAAQGNFAFIKTGMPVKDFVTKMRAEGVVVGRPFPPLLEWARITVGLPEEMEVCHLALRKVLG